VLNNAYIISISGLQPSGNYSLIDHNHVSTDITDSTSFGRNILTASSYAAQNKLGWEGIAGPTMTAKVGGQYYAPSAPSFGVTYTINDPDTANAGDFYTIIKYPNSQNFSIGGITYTEAVVLYRINNSLGGWTTYKLSDLHYHTTSQITDFNSSVSGLIIGSGNYLSVFSNSGSGITNSIVYQNNNKIGIGTIDPSGIVHIINDDIALYIGDYSIWTGGGKLRVFVDDDDNQAQAIKAFTSRSGVGIHYGINGTSYTINGNGSGTNVGLYGYAGNGQKNWGLWIDAGQSIFDDKVGIKTQNPVYDLDVIGSGHFSENLYVNNIPVSISGHSHISSDLLDFNSSVSGLIPIQNITGVSGVQISASGTSRQISTNFIAGNGISFNYNNDESLTISTITNNGLISITNNSTTNLTIPSGYVIGSLSIYQNGVKLLDNIDYTATDGSGVTLLYPPTSGSYIEYLSPTTSIQNAGNYANAIHSHLSSDITNFNSSVSGLLPSVSGNEYITTSFLNNIYTISATGLQPSGNYANAIHSHLSSDISNFNSSVSGLLPTVSGSGYVTSSLINNSYIVSVTGLQPSGNYSTVGHSHTLSNITDASSIYDTSIYSLGTISGTISINYGTDRMIQTFNIDTNPLTLNKGSGWPTTNISRDVLLIMNCINSTSITWNIVGDDWYNQPTTTLPSGEYMILLRAIGSGTIQGHYIGSKQGPL